MLDLFEAFTELTTLTKLFSRQPRLTCLVMVIALAVFGTIMSTLFIIGILIRASHGSLP